MGHPGAKEVGMRGSRLRVGVAGGPSHVHLEAGPSPVREHKEGRTRPLPLFSLCSLWVGVKGPGTAPWCWGAEPTAHRCGGGEERDEAGRGKGTQGVRPAGFGTGPHPWAGPWERLAPTSDPTHRSFPKFQELTQDHRREEKQLPPPDFHLGPHPDVTAAAEPGTDPALPAAARTELGPQVESTGPPSAPDWLGSRPFAFRLEEAAATPLSDSPPPGVVPPTTTGRGGAFPSPRRL